MQAGWRALRGCGAARIGCPMAAPGSRRIGRLRVVSQGGRLDDSARGSGDGDAGPMGCSKPFRRPGGEVQPLAKSTLPHSWSSVILKKCHGSTGYSAAHRFSALCHRLRRRRIIVRKPQYRHSGFDSPVCADCACNGTDVSGGNFYCTAAHGCESGRCVGCPGHDGLTGNIAGLAPADAGLTTARPQP
jgi:hypothetical protein